MYLAGQICSYLPSEPDSISLNFRFSCFCFAIIKLIRINNKGC